jgi:hypothetical protein
MINNIELIKPLLDFSEPGDFYMLYIFKRKKDQPIEERENHQSVRTIKSYTVESIEYLGRRWDEIVQLCEMFKARAYIHIQKQNHRDVSLDMMMALAERIKNGHHDQKGLFDSVVGQMKTYERRWIVDIDTKDNSEVLKVKLVIDSCRPFAEDKVIAEIPTKNGFHLITKRFDVIEFKKRCPGVDIQKKNPTLLYLPDSLSE